MDIEANVVEISRSGETNGLGCFKFSEIPSANDRIILPAISGDLDIMEVLYVEHYPVKISIDPDNRVEQYLKETENPKIIIYVRFSGRDTGSE